MSEKATISDPVKGNTGLSVVHMAIADQFQKYSGLTDKKTK